MFLKSHHLQIRSTWTKFQLKVMLKKMGHAFLNELCLLSWGLCTPCYELGKNSAQCCNEIVILTFFSLVVSQNFRRTPHREVKCIFKLVYIFAYVYIIFILFLFLTTAKIIDLLLWWEITHIQCCCNGVNKNFIFIA